MHHVVTEQPRRETSVIARQEGRQDLHALSAASIGAHQRKATSPTGVLWSREFIRNLFQRAAGLSISLVQSAR